MTKYTDGKIEIEFFDIDKNAIMTFGNARDGLPQDLAVSLADSLARNIWVKIDYENGKVGSISFEEYNFSKDAYRLKEKLERVWKGYLERS